MLGVQIIQKEEGKGMDEIRIYGLECYAYHGVYEEEKKKGQRFVINATLYQNMDKASGTDEITDSTHYGQVCEFMNRFMQENPKNLLEAVAGSMADAVLSSFPLLQGIDLEIEKPEAPIPLPFQTVSVKLHRSWHKVYLSVGSNMGDKEKWIGDGIAALSKHPRIKEVETSRLLWTKPYGGVRQEDFLNGVIALQTTLSPEELLEFLHQVEKAAGRERKIHWGPRTLDLDIIFYDKLVMETEDLILPHIDMENRFFVLKPLSEMCPNFRHPVTGQTVSQMLAKLESQGGLDTGE